MKVSEVMHRFVATAYNDSTVNDIWKLIFKKRINAVPIVDKNKRLLGIITKEDLLGKLYPNYSEYVSNLNSARDFEEMETKSISLGKKKIADLMNRKVVFTREDTEALRALSRMIVRHVNQLPVLSNDNKIVGIITKGDVFYALFKKKIEPAARAAGRKIRHKKRH